MTGDLDELSRAHKRLDEGRLTSAGINFRESLAPLDRTATPEQMALSLVGLGRICYARGDVARARLYAEEALRHLSVSREAKELLSDLTSPDQPPNAHDSWRREADLAKQRGASSSPEAPSRLRPQAASQARRRLFDCCPAGVKCSRSASCTPESAGSPLSSARLERP